MTIARSKLSKFEQNIIIRMDGTRPCKALLRPVYNQYPTRGQRNPRINLLVHPRAVARNHARTYPCSFIGAYLAALQPRAQRA